MAVLIADPRSDKCSCSSNLITTIKYLLCAPSFRERSNYTTTGLIGQPLVAVLWTIARFDVMKRSMFLLCTCSPLGHLLHLFDSFSVLKLLTARCYRAMFPGFTERTSLDALVAIDN